MRLVRRDLTFSEALVGMIGNIAVILTEPHLYCIELIAGELHAAVDAGRVIEFFRLVLIGRICDYILKSLLLWLGELALSLLRIRYILKRASGLAPYIPYLRDSHQTSLLFGRRNAFSIAF